MRPQRRSVVAVVAAMALALSACSDATSETRQPEAPNDGIQLSGRLGGAQLSISFGDPDFLITDCDTEDGLDSDWCLVTRSIDGARVEIVFENPAAFVAGAELDIAFDRCVDCDDVRDVAIIDVIVDGDRRRAIGGTVRVIEAAPRYAMELSMRFDDGGTLFGEFNVRPLGALVPAEERFDAESPSG